MNQAIGIVEKKEKSEKKSTFNSKIADVLSYIVWIYTISKLFFIDIDLVILQIIAPDFQYIIFYRFFIIIAAVSVAWLFLNASFRMYVIYVVVFPIIFILWKVPKFIWKSKSWILLFTVINFILSFIKNIKHNFISKSLLLLSCLTIIICKSAYLIIPAICALFFYIIYEYIREIVSSFKVTDVFALQAKILRWLGKPETCEALIFPEETILALQVDSLNESQLSIYKSKLELGVILTKGYLYIAEKLKDYRDTNIHIMFNIFSYISLFMEFVLVFAFINYGLYKVSPTQFRIDLAPNIFNFIYYSLVSLVPNDIAGFQPLGALAILLKVITTIFGFILLPVIGLNVIYSLKNDNYKREIDSAVASIVQDSQQLEARIQDKYNITMEQAIKMILEWGSGLVKLLYFIIPDVTKENSTQKSN